jgi:hypothetical protein
VYCDAMITDIIKKAQFELNLKLDLYLTDGKQNRVLGQIYEVNFIEMLMNSAA